MEQEKTTEQIYKFTKITVTYGSDDTLFSVNRHQNALINKTEINFYQESRRVKTKRYLSLCYLLKHQTTSLKQTHLQEVDVSYKV